MTCMHLYFLIHIGIYWHRAYWIYIHTENNKNKIFEKIRNDNMISNLFCHMLYVRVFSTNIFGMSQKQQQQHQNQCPNAAMLYLYIIRIAQTIFTVSTKVHPIPNLPTWLHWTALVKDTFLTNINASSRSYILCVAIYLQYSYWYKIIILR